MLVEDKTGEFLIPPVPEINEIEELNKEGDLTDFNNNEDEEQ